MTQKINRETEQNIAQLQLMEQNITQLMMQRQAFQGQLLEIENAIKEIGQASGQSYKIIGNVMVASSKEDLKKDLEEKKEMFELRIKNYEKQEKTIKEKAEELQASVLKELKK
ncbi:MAG: prefoldin subunit beta [Candidatus Nanoarchaeia archaeon]|nr:prefoldin subunit beta [Candidatus Nanoarchaeia archaeon]